MIDSTPQGPWYNPEVADGIYDASITCVKENTYGADESPYLQLVFWLAAERCFFVTNLYFPKDKPDNRSAHRLAGLCRCLGLVPQDVVD